MTSQRISDIITNERLNENITSQRLNEIITSQRINKNWELEPEHNTNWRLINNLKSAPHQ